MKKRFLAVFMLLVVLVAGVFADGQVPAYPVMNQAALSSVKYEVIYTSDSDDYIVVECDGEYYVVYIGNSN